MSASRTRNIRSTALPLIHAGAGAAGMRGPALGIGRWSLLPLCLIAFAACATPAPTPLPPPAPTGIRAVGPTFPEELIVRRKAKSVTMRIYNTGSVRTRGGAVSSMKSWSAKVNLDVPVFLIKHSTGGYILFDTGLSTATVEKISPGFITSFYVKFRSQPGQDIISQLKADGVNPEDVHWVVLSHLHLDHADHAADFPNATMVVSRKEWETQKAKQAEDPDPDKFDPAQYEGKWKLRLIDFSTAPAFGAFDHAQDLLGDGSVFVVDLPGHTPGSMGAWVNLDGGPALLAGDAAWVIDNYMDLALPVGRAIDNLDQYWRSLHEMKAMQEVLPRLVIFPGHDLSPRYISTRDDLPVVPFKPK